MAIATTNPATGEVVKNFRIARCGADRAETAVGGRCVQRLSADFFRRASCKNDAAAEILEKEKDECAHLMTLEMGKPLKAAVAEAMKCATGCRYYAENAEKFLADEIDRNWRQAQLHPLSADWPHPGNHAVEFSLLAGVSFRRAGADGRECRDC